MATEGLTCLTSQTQGALRQKWRWQVLSMSPKAKEEVGDEVGEGGNKL